MKLYGVIASLPVEAWHGFRFKPWVERFRKWQVVQALKQQVAKERRELAELPDDILKDMGVSAGDAWLESQRSSGDLPAFRVRIALANARRFQ